MAGASTTTGAAGTEIVLVGADNGVVVVTSDTPLRRLNYFDGKFLRAEDMQAEQDYLRFLVQLSNRAGGSGIVNGYDTVLAPGGAAVTVGQGLALDALGRVLLMPIAKTMALDDLIAATAKAQKTLAAGAAGSADFGDCVVITPPTATTSGQSGDLYLLTVGFLEALCGEEDVFGQICDDACVQSKDRRWRMEGVVFRAVPLTLKTALKVPTAVAVNANQLRNRVASAYFQDERLRVASLVSGTSIKESATWCLGAQAEIGDAVPLAVFSRSGGATKFLDAWTARRERMETPPRRYWAWRLAMRPWDVFLAQVLQFQCQLHDLLTGKGDGGTGGGGDPCAPKTAALGRAAEMLAQLETWHAKVAQVLTPARLEGTGLQPFGIDAIRGLKDDLGKLAVPGTAPSDRILVDGGILDLPPAGYLPVDVAGKLTVNEQVRAFMGPGVDLRYCIVTPDYVPHALEMRQHMDRIPLTDGIDDPAAKPKVDILVPGGRIVEDKLAGGGTAYQLRADAPGSLEQPVFGVANGARRNDNGGTFTLAGTTAGVQLEKLVAALKALGSRSQQPQPPPTPPTPITREHLDLATRIAARSAVEEGALRERPPATHPLFELAARGDLIGAVETTVSVDADPFELDVSGSTGLQLDAFLGVKSQAGALAHLTAGGTLFPRTKGTTPQGIDYVLGTISGSYAVSGTGSTSPGQNLVWEYVLLRKATGGSGTVHARVTAGTTLAARLPFVAAWYTWSGDPLKGVLKIFQMGANQLREGAAAAAGAFMATASAALVDIPPPPTTLPWLEVDLTQDPAVLDPTEQHHVLAESALQILAAMMSNGPDWQKATEAALFPRPPAGAGNITVLGERDWVLFARRRLSTCADEAVTPKRPNRHYHVYLHEAQDEKEAEQWVKALLGGQGTFLQGAQFVGFVDFDAATADPVDAAGLRAEIDPVKGDALRFIVTASDYGDGVSEEGRRRAHLEQTASPVLDVTGASPIDLAALPKLFEGRVDGGQTVHGVVVLVAVAQVTVVSVRGGAWEIGRTVFFQEGPGGQLTVNDPMEFGSVDRFRPLGSVRFRNGVADPEELKVVVTEWTKLAGPQNRALAHVVAVTPKDAAADDDAAARGEASAIRQAVPTPGVTPTLWNTHASQAFTEPDALAFLIAGPVIQAPTLSGRVVLVKPDGVQAVKPLLEEGRVVEVLTRQKRFVQPVPDVEFDAGALRDPGPLAEAWRELTGGSPPSAVMTLVQGGDAALAREARAQSKSVATAVTVAGASAPPISLLKVTDAREEPPAGSVPVFHLVLPKT